jgi:hypothetical protein
MLNASSSQVLQPLGDALPEAAVAYYSALDAGRWDDAVACFEVSAAYAVPGIDEIETGPRRVFRGRDEIRRALVERPPARALLQHRADLSVTRGDVCLLEGVVVNRADGVPVESFAASIQLSDGGLISRYLAFRCEPPIAAIADAATHGDGNLVGEEALDRYFASLEAGEFEDAVDCFSSDVMYSHPPYGGDHPKGGQRIVFSGRAELLAGFQMRGRRAVRHQLLTHEQRGRHALVEGIVDHVPGDVVGSFLSSYSIDADGRIQRYASFYCQPGLPPHPIASESADSS